MEKLFIISAMKFISGASKTSLKLHKIFSCPKILVSFTKSGVVLYRLCVLELLLSVWTKISVTCFKAFYQHCSTETLSLTVKK